MNDATTLQGHGGRSPAFAVVAHVFYADVWSLLAEHIGNLRTPFDLYATLPDAPEFDRLAAAIAAQFPDSRVLRTPNRGRDVAPFLRAMDAFDLYRYDAILKLHTKRSTHLQQHGARWANDLFRSLVGDDETVEAALRIFGEFPQVGMIYPDFVKVPISAELIPNLRWLDQLQARLGRARSVLENGWEFAAGTMFWFRGAAMMPLRDLRFGVEDFEPENGQINGTLAHALERVFPQIIYKSGHLVVTADRIAEVQRSALARVVGGLNKPPPPVRKGFRIPPKRGSARR